MKKACMITAGLLLFIVVISLMLTFVAKVNPMSDKVALVKVEGPIVDSKDTVDEIKEHVKDGSIKAIVLRVDSPGGMSAPSQEIYAEVKKAAEKKKVVVSMGSLAASGGYYIACPATKIFANPGTLTGSIGVIMEIPNFEGLMSKIGVRTEVIKSGKNKDIGSAFRKMTKEERALLQGVMDNVHEQFMTAVATGRRMKMEDVRKIADGRIFTGEQAKKHGLVDEIGTLDDAVHAAGKMAGIEGEPEVMTKKEAFSLLDIFRNKIPKELADVFPSVKIKYIFSP